MYPQLKNRMLSPEERFWGGKKSSHRKKDLLGIHSLLASEPHLKASPPPFLQTLLLLGCFVFINVPRNLRGSAVSNGFIRKTVAISSSDVASSPGSSSGPGSQTGQSWTREEQEEGVAPGGQAGNMLVSATPVHTPWASRTSDPKWPGSF